MAYNEKLTARIREALSDIPNVEQKIMFSGVTFMVDGKMCISAGDHRIMCRIDPAIHHDVIKNRACSTVMMKGREYIGYVNVSEDTIEKKEDLAYWIGLALTYNKSAIAAKKKH